MDTHPNSGLRQIGPHGYLLAGRHIRVPVPAERVLQLLQLLGRKVRSLSPLPLVLLVVLRVVVAGRDRVAGLVARGHHFCFNRSFI